MIQGGHSQLSIEMDVFVTCVFLGTQAMKVIQPFPKARMFIQDADVSCTSAVS
jgi:hypothetical protein